MDVDLGMTRSTESDVTLRSQNRFSFVGDSQRVAVGQASKSTVVWRIGLIVSWKFSVVVTIIVEVVASITWRALEAGSDDILTSRNLRFHLAHYFSNIMSFLPNVQSWIKQKIYKYSLYKFVFFIPNELHFITSIIFL